MRARLVRSGLLNLAKPAGITSRDAVNRVQKLAKPAKVGHAGTLDPLATGVLVVCIGSTTRLVTYVQDQRKQYRARFRLGEVSDTDDITGTIVATAPTGDISVARLQTDLQQFVGRIEQVPPKVSAVHVGGQRAYQLARAGRDFELTPRIVEVDSIDLIDASLPEFTVDIVCSGGTYIRSIGRDLGERLGCGALMTELERTAVGPFHVSDAAPLEAVTPETLSDWLQPPAAAVAGLPTVNLDDDQVTSIRCGRSVPCKTVKLADGAEVAMLNSAGDLVGVAAWDAGTGRIQPRVVLPPE